MLMRFKVVLDVACVVSLAVGLAVTACRIPFVMTCAVGSGSRRGEWFDEIADGCLRSASAASVARPNKPLKLTAN